MRRLFLDVETRNEDLVCVAAAYDADPIRACETIEPWIVAGLEDPAVALVSHTKYDPRWLALHGYTVRAVPHDTQVMAWLVNETLPSLSLEALVKRYLGQDMDKRLSENAKKWKQDDGQLVLWQDAPLDEVKAYNIRDVAAMRRLYRTLTDLLQREELLDYFMDTEAPFTQVLLGMEEAGMPVDLEAVAALKDTYMKARAIKEAVLVKGLPTAFNIRSPQQVASYLGTPRFLVDDRVLKTEELSDELLLRELAEVEPAAAVPGEFVPIKAGRVYVHGHWVVRGLGKGHPLQSVDQAHLTDLLPHATKEQAEFIHEYLDWKAYDKLLSTYLDVFEEKAVKGPNASARIHARFNQTGTVTGRLSSSQPNLQNIPARGQHGALVRDLFRGNLVVGDFSQLEPRLQAHFSQDPEMLRVFRAGEDLYQVVADEVGCDRQVAKVLVLSMGYGAGAEKVASILARSGFAYTIDQAKQLLNRTKVLFSAYFAWRERTIKLAASSGEVVTIDGRKRRISSEQFSWRTGSDRQAANAVIQGSAADIVRRVMLRTNKLFPELTLLCQVHDELVWEEDPARPVDLARLQKWVQLEAQRDVSVPLPFEPHRGSSWLTAKSGGAAP